MMRLRFNIVIVLLGACSFASAPNASGHEDHDHKPKKVTAKAAHKPSDLPDRIILTWAGNPATTQAVTWRTSTEVEEGLAEIAVAEAGPEFSKKGKQLTAASQSLTTDLGEARYHSVKFEDLKPGTKYAYRVGDGENWSEWFHFTTASAAPEPFSFIYFGDAQNDIRSLWSRVIREAYGDAPKARFMIHAGDLVNTAESDAEWGEWFQAGDWLNAMVPSVPVPGNHEIAKYDDDKKRLSIHWRPQFALPEDGPAGLEETCYTLVYHNLRIIGLNSNTEIDRQAAWLDDVLAKNSSPWVVCTFHHPVFSTAKDRDNPKIRAAWKPVLDKYRVDLVLQGHDHTYGRTGLETPAADVETVANVPTGVNKVDAQTGTVYVVSVSGPKMYNLDRKDFMKRAAEDTQLYQIIHIDGGTLRYEARTAIGEVYDAFVLKKRPGQINELIEETPATPERRRSPAPAAAGKPGRTRVSFQQGIDGYKGTVDTELWEVAPTKVLEKQGTMTSDANNGGGESQILLRYEKIFGTEPGQIPPRSRIVSARLTVVAFDPGNTVFLHRVLVPWSGSSTWNSMSAGLSSDDLEATRLRDGFTFGDIVMDKQQVDFDVAGAIQSWANGAPNHGWVFINTGANGWDFYSSDWHETDLRPSLVVEFEAPAQGGAAKNEQAAKEPAEKGPSTK